MPAMCSSNQFNCNPATEYGRRPLQARERDIVLGIQQTVNLGTAGLEQRGETRLRDFLFLHSLGQLPRNDLLDCLRLRLVEYAFALEKIVDARTHVFLAHRSSS